MCIRDSSRKQYAMLVEVDLPTEQVIQYYSEGKSSKNNLNHSQLFRLVKLVGRILSTLITSN